MFCSQCLNFNRQGDKTQNNWWIVWWGEKTYQISLLVDENAANQHPKVDSFRVLEGQIIQISHSLDFILLETNTEKSLNLRNIGTIL